MHVLEKPVENVLTVQHVELYPLVASDGYHVVQEVPHTAFLRPADEEDCPKESSSFVYRREAFEVQVHAWQQKGNDLAVFENVVAGNALGYLVEG